MRMATWNVNSLKVRLPHVEQWLQETGVEILCLQELKMEHDKFPLEALRNIGYDAVWLGQKTYNGVAIIYKQGLSVEDVVTGIPDYADVQSRVIAASIEGVRVICAYFVNGDNVESEKYAYKLTWLAHMQRYISASLQQHSKLALLGDYNIAPADADVYEPEKFKDQVLCSAPERAAFFNLIQMGLTDAYRLFHPDEEKPFTWWDYRAMMFRRNMGLRIDHILVSDELKKSATACEIDKAPRKWERPSDHTPVILTY